MKKSFITLLLIIITGTFSACGTNSKVNENIDDSNTSTIEQREENIQREASQALEEEGDFQSKEKSSSDLYYEMGDIDGNGIIEYAVIREEIPQDITLYFNNEEIFTYHCAIPISVPLGLYYLDLDEDEVEEIVFTIQPMVNSSAGMVFVTLKKNGEQWLGLDGYEWETGNDTDNHFPIHIIKGKGQFSAEISCDGLEKTIVVDVSEVRQCWREVTMEIPIDKYWGHFDYWMKAQYTNVFPKMQDGEECARLCPFGVWEIRTSEYNGSPCLVALHGIECFARADFGYVEVYFNYNEKGMIQPLDLKFYSPKQYDSMGLITHKNDEVDAEFLGDNPVDVYKKIRENYRTEIENRIGESEEKPVIIYSETDINKDGENELIIGVEKQEVSNEKSVVIMDIFTWKEDRAYRLFPFLDGKDWTCELLKDGTIRLYYKGTSEPGNDVDDENYLAEWEAYVYYILPVEGTAVTPVDAVYHIQTKQGEVLYMDVDEIEISEEVFRKRSMEARFLLELKYEE